MNSQDITRALIDTTVARAMVEMDADPKRSVRKLCDLGRQFSRGRFQNQIFAIFQDLLRNDESPYYQAIDFLLRSNDPHRDRPRRCSTHTPHHTQNCRTTHSLWPSGGSAFSFVCGVLVLSYGNSSHFLHFAFPFRRFRQRKNFYFSSTTWNI